MSPIDLSLVLACYNEEGHFDDSVAEIIEVLENTRLSYEIIFVDDCSRDRTRNVIDDLVRENPKKPLRKIFHERNTGRGGAVSDGIRAAEGDVVGFLDIDLEVHAHYIPSFVLSILNGADVAMAHRVYKLHWLLLYRHILSRGYVWLVKTALGIPFEDTEAGYKFFRRERILPILEQTRDKGWFWDTEIIVRCLLAGYRIDEIPCLFIRRWEKQSTVRPIHDSLDYLAKLYRFQKEVRRLRRNP